MKMIDMLKNGHQSFRRGRWLPTPLLFFLFRPESVALIWSEAEGWIVLAQDFVALYLTPDPSPQEGAVYTRTELAAVERLIYEL